MGLSPVKLDITPPDTNGFPTAFLVFLVFRCILHFDVSQITSLAMTNLQWIYVKRVKSIMSLHRLLNGDVTISNVMVTCQMELSTDYGKSNTFTHSPLISVKCKIWGSDLAFRNSKFAVSDFFYFFFLYREAIWTHPKLCEFWNVFSLCLEPAAINFLIEIEEIPGRWKGTVCSWHCVESVAL